MKSSKLRYSIALGLPLAGAAAVAPVMATELAVKIELPQLNVGRYHKPYVAFWVEKADQTFSTNLAVWYNPPKGNKWLNEMRQWWRQSGRDLNYPIDGLSSATRGPGEYDLKFSNPELNKLPAGGYQLVVEVGREHGGHEVVRVPFQLPAKAGQVLSAKGSEEVATVSLQVIP